MTFEQAAQATLPSGRPAATQDERQAQIDTLDPDARVLERFDKASTQPSLT